MASAPRAGTFFFGKASSWQLRFLKIISVLEKQSM